MICGEQSVMEAGTKYCALCYSQTCSSLQRYMPMNLHTRNTKAGKNRWVPGLSSGFKAMVLAAAASEVGVYKTTQDVVDCNQTKATGELKQNISVASDSLLISKKKHEHTHTCTHRHTLPYHSSAPREQFIPKVLSFSHKKGTVF